MRPLNCLFEQVQSLVRDEISANMQRLSRAVTSQIDKKDTDYLEASNRLEESNGIIGELDGHK